MADPIDAPTVDAEPAAMADAGQTTSITPKTGHVFFAGYTLGQLAVGLVLLVALVWAMWVTRALTAQPPQHIVKADLSRIVGQYVQAQARSNAPPAQVQAEMRAFMQSLEGELARRGDAGQVVLVGEAVLSKSVPDITSDVVGAVYASGVKPPVLAAAPATGDATDPALASAISGLAIPAPGGQ